MPDEAGSAQLLEDVYSYARLQAFDADGYRQALARELGAVAAGGASLDEVAAVDELLRGALAAIHGFAGRVMRLRLDREVDDAIAVATKKVFAATVLGYGGDLRLLGERARDAALRDAPGRAEQAAAAVVAAAVATLELHAQLCAEVFVLVRGYAAAAEPAAGRAARDRALDDNPRLRWSAVRRDLAALQQRPELLAKAALSDRVAALPPVLEEPEPAPELSRAELLELD